MSVEEKDLNLLKLNLQEKTPDVFTEEDLINLLDTHKNVWLASYYGCCLKATMNSDVELPGGLKLAGNSLYWKELADVYYAKYTESINNSNEDSNEDGLVLNKAGYKNSMRRVDEFPRRRGW